MNREIFNNLLLISGTGRKVGKTTLACMLINRFSRLKPSAVKISPHLHNIAGKGSILFESKDFLILEENDLSGIKDSSKMLLSGANKAFYIQSEEKYTGEAFSYLTTNFMSEEPIICESASLAKFVRPAFHIRISGLPGEKIKDGQQGIHADKSIINSGNNLIEFADSVSFINNKWATRQ